MPIRSAGPVTGSVGVDSDRRKRSTHRIPPDGFSPARPPRPTRHRQPRQPRRATSWSTSHARCRRTRTNLGRFLSAPGRGHGPPLCRGTTGRRLPRHDLLEAPLRRLHVCSMQPYYGSARLIVSPYSTVVGQKPKLGVSRGFLRIGTKTSAAMLYSERWARSDRQTRRCTSSPEWPAGRR